jgi:maleylpyruvate isomerase
VGGGRPVRSVAGAVGLAVTTINSLAFSITLREIDGVTTVAGDGPHSAAAVARRTDEVVRALGSIGDEELLAPSALPGWDRLTVACHLRYGALALGRLTRAAIEGHAAAYYPQGRSRQRPGTLRPEPGETPSDVVASLARRSAELDALWSGLTDEQWRLDVVEPPDNPDLGPLPLTRLPLLRLTEVEVHGSDLDLGLDDWSPVFVESALTFRLDRLNARRPRGRDRPDDTEGSWLLVATDGPTYLVTVEGPAVSSRPATPTTSADAVIEASSRDLLALLLGRPLLRPARCSGNDDLAAAFRLVFPGP